MTEKHDLKRRIRARQAMTGERYTVARDRVLRARGSDLLLELHEVSHEARAAGFACRVWVTSSIWAARDRIAVLLDELHGRIATASSELAPLRRAALHGAMDRAKTIAIGDPPRLVDAFLHGLASGKRGQALDGRVLTFDSAFAGSTRTVVGQSFPRASEAGIALSLFHERSVANVPEAWTIALPIVLEVSP